ncbi:MAG: M1 family metallopeptidase [Chitinophagaceae bacterium]|nr:M1 family metallopeptidase [Chitinophagaceae bacterium]
MHKCLLVPALFFSCFSFSQQGYWQQRVKYTMDVNVDATTNRFTGKQKLEYTNNSPDTLHKLFYHLYWNAFQPGSMMDAKSLYLGTVKLNNQPDWDPRVKDRISKLTPDEIGYQKVASLTMNGVAQKMKVHETIMEVELSKPIAPKATVALNMDFESQVPKQIRRSGRDAANGVRYSMSQWYPKLCEYDRDGWDVTPYVEREFYGVWGDFDVTISIDKSYIIGATGYLQNPQEIGYGYEKAGTTVAKPAGSKLKWHFKATNVHDFVWAADPEFKHVIKKTPGGPDFHLLYKTGSEEAWKEIGEVCVEIYPFIEKNFGAYPYRHYSIIQGGDGGMEYPMATLVSGPSLGTVFHELMHSWYHGVLANNESLYPWMDEGFADWATDRVQYYFNDVIQRRKFSNNPASLRIVDSLAKALPKYHSDVYNAYFSLWRGGVEEPLTTQADEYQTRTGYYLGAYSKGSMYLAQLGYIAGDETLMKIMQEYYRQWKFKHPSPNDFLRIAEKESGLQLDWYRDYWINTTKHIEYAIDSLWEEGGKSLIRLKRNGEMPMPVDLQFDYKDGTKEIAYVPMYLMFGEKPVEDKSIPRTVFPSWKWTHATYIVSVNKKLSEIKTIEIDPSRRMADVERRNNKIDIPF